MCPARASTASSLAFLDGPWRVANDEKEHVYAVQHLVTSELRDVNVARMRFNDNDQLEITRELLKVDQQMKHKGEYHIRSISTITWAAGGDEFVVKVACEVLKGSERTRELVSSVFHEELAVLRRELKAPWLKAKQERALVPRYGLRLRSYCGLERVPVSEFLTFGFV